MKNYSHTHAVYKIMSGRVKYPVSYYCITLTISVNAKFTVKRPSKSYKQNSGGKKEKTFSKNAGKLQCTPTKKHQVTDDYF